MPKPAFAKDPYRLPLKGGRAVTLEPPDRASADFVAQAMCRIDPWLTLQAKPEHLSAALTGVDAHFHPLMIRDGDAVAGVVAVRSPWLYGPYLSLLAVLPAYQRTGIGGAMLGWMADEAGEAARNLWVCASQFNPRAIAFYERHGFDRVGLLPDLIVPGLAEVLLRKRLR